MAIIYDDEEERRMGPECQQCGYPFLTSVRNEATGQWASRCGNCGDVAMLTPAAPLTPEEGQRDAE